MSTSITTNRAFFVNRPREINDLFIPHPVEKEQSFYVKKHIVLLPHDYENFVTDLLVEREYIAKSEFSYTGRDDILECLFVTQMNSDEGVLVVPDENGFIKLAASCRCSDCYSTPNYRFAIKSMKKSALTPRLRRAFV